MKDKEALYIKIKKGAFLQTVYVSLKLIQRSLYDEIISVEIFFQKYFCQIECMVCYSIRTWKSK